MILLLLSAAAPIVVALCLVGASRRPALPACAPCRALPPGMDDRIVDLVVEAMDGGRLERGEIILFCARGLGPGPWPPRNHADRATWDRIGSVVDLTLLE